MAEPPSTAERRYLEYLRTFGIADRAENVLAMRELDLDGVRFFAFEDDQGIRLKAAITRTGHVRPGRHEEDDWYGLLRGSADGAALAERLAWLETDESRGPEVVSPAVTVVLHPADAHGAAIDPRLASSVPAPALSAGADGTLVLRAWLLEAARDPVRWIVTAPPRGRARVDRQPAATPAAGRSPSVDEATQARAIERLATGSEPDCLWALRVIAEAGGTRALPALAALLADPAASEAVGSLAAATLARLGAEAAVSPLGQALGAAGAPAIRKACAQALGRLPSAAAVAELARAARHEPDEGVRAEIVHALSAQGAIARTALEGIAAGDETARIRDLARGYIEGMR